MSILQKPAIVLILLLLLACVYLMLNNTSEYTTYQTITSSSSSSSTLHINVSNSRERNAFKKVARFIGISSHHAKGNSQAVQGYIADEIQFDNVKAIGHVINAELNELEKLGIKRDSVLQHVEVKVKKTKQKKKQQDNAGGNQVKLSNNGGNQVTKEIQVDDGNQVVTKVADGNQVVTKVADGNQVVTKQRHLEGNYEIIDGSKIRVKYNFRNPRAKDIAKLSRDQIDIEEVTDPLPTSAKCPKVTFLTVFVVSMPRNFLRRQHIRDSWGSSYSHDVELLKHAKPMKEEIPVQYMFRVVFVMGVNNKGTHMDDVHKEAMLNKDIVFGSLIEDYRNLTMKTRLGLKWIFFECNSRYMVKTDDDVFMNPVMLVEWLKDMPRKNFYTGWCNFNSPVIREKRNKWYVSYEDFAPSNYPGYCLGGGYLMSNDVVGKVISLSYGRKLFPMEDLYVGLMMQEIKEVHIRDEKGHFDLVFGGRAKECDLNGLFLAHQIYGNKMLTLFKRAQKAIVNC